MAYSPNSPVTVPIELTGIARLLGHNGSDVRGVYLSENINMWARYKPVHASDPFDNNNGAGDNNNYGIDYSAIEDSTTVMTMAGEGMCRWEYERPRGGANSPFRLGDFRGYYHNVVCPLQIVMPTEVVEMSASSGGVEVRMEEYIPAWNENYGLRVSQVLSKYGSYYLTAVLSQNGVVKATYMSDSSWGSGNYDARELSFRGIDDIGLTYGEFHVDVFLSSGSRAVSLEVKDGESHRDLIYKPDTVLTTIYANLMVLELFSSTIIRHGSSTYIRYDINTIIWTIGIPQIQEFWNRYYQHSGLTAEWKIQIYVEDALDQNQNYVTHEWLDVTDWATLADTLSPSYTDMDVSQSDFPIKMEYFYADYEQGLPGSHEYRLRLLLHVKRNGVVQREYDIERYTFDVPINGRDVEIYN